MNKDRSKLVLYRILSNGDKGLIRIAPQVPAQRQRQIVSSGQRERNKLELYRINVVRPGIILRIRQRVPTQRQRQLLSSGQGEN